MTNAKLMVMLAIEYKGIEELSQGVEIAFEVLNVG